MPPTQPREEGGRCEGPVPCSSLGSCGTALLPMRLLRWWQQGSGEPLGETGTHSSHRSKDKAEKLERQKLVVEPAFSVPSFHKEEMEAIHFYKHVPPNAAGSVLGTGYCSGRGKCAGGRRSPLVRDSPALSISQE